MVSWRPVREHVGQVQQATGLAWLQCQRPRGMGIPMKCCSIPPLGPVEQGVVMTLTASRTAPQADR